MKDEIPTVAGLAIALGFSRETVYDWAKQQDKREFSDIVADLQAIQERLLLNNGLRSFYNSKNREAPALIETWLCRTDGTHRREWNAAH